MKFAFFISTVLITVLIIGCGTKSSDVERIGISDPGQSSKFEPSTKADTTSSNRTSFPGANKVEPTQVEFRMPKILNQSSDDLALLVARIEELEDDVHHLERDIDDLEWVIDDLESDIYDLERDIDFLESDIDDLR
jgi:peptidoglycan hydrolase CwlO-like protein